MPEEEITQRKGKLGIGIALIVAIGGTSGFVTLAFSLWYNIPSVTYYTSLSYVLPSPLNDKQITIISIKNVGHASATNMRVSIVTTGPITNSYIDSLEEVSIEPWQNETRLRFSQSRLAPGDYIQITMIVKLPIGLTVGPIYSINVVFDQGMAIKEEEQTLASLYWLSLLPIAIFGLTTFLLGYYISANRLMRLNSRKTSGSFAGDWMRVPSRSKRMATMVLEETEVAFLLYSPSWK